MTLVKNILGRIFALWAMLVFIITMLFFYLPMVITGFWNEPKRTLYFLKVARAWMAVFFPLAFLRLSIRGRQHFAEGQSYIVVCNHNSLMDVPVSSPGVPGANKTIAKHTMARIPLFGLIYRRGSVLVNRADEKSRRDSYEKMKEVLTMGMHMIIYPEGTRNKTDQALKTFHSGAFRLASETGRPVIPALLFGTAKALPWQKAMYYWPTHLHMHFLEPVQVAVGDDPEALKEKVFHIMESYYSQYRNKLA